MLSLSRSAVTWFQSSTLSSTVARRFLILLAVLLIANSAARLWWLSWSDDAIYSSNLNSTDFKWVQGPQMLPEAQHGSLSLDQLLAKRIFGEQLISDSPQRFQAQVELQAVDTELNVQLKGVVDSRNSQLARAIIASGARQQSYALGDALEGVGHSVTLVKVLADRVILDSRGRYESLWLYPEGKAQPANAPQHGSSSHSSNLSSKPNRPTNLGVVSNDTSASLGDLIKFSVARRAGKVIGYKIRPGRQHQQFLNLGLETDDIVTHINGISLDSASKAMEVYRAVQGQTQATVTLLRGDQTLSLDLAIEGGEI